MNKLIVDKMYFLFAILISILLMIISGCTTNTTSPITEVRAKPLETSTLPQDKSPIQTDNQTAKQDKPAESATKIEVIYFHLIQRCPTCLCFEERINSVIKTNFSQEINSGKIAFQVLTIQDEKNAAIVKKYGAIAAQLFLNRIINGKDNIVDIQEIWDWNCRGDKTAFDQKIKNLIETSLKQII